MGTRTRSIVSPEDQRVTFVELFFDLVFVFSVTQVVGLLYHHLDLTGLGQTVLVFWLVWWAWTQFTWALNLADTTHPQVEIGTLMATAVAFFMAVSAPDAFAGGAARFAVPYVIVRLIGLGLYFRVSRVAGPSHYAAVRLFSLLSLGGLAGVLVGAFAGGEAIYGFWGLAILLDLAAALIAGNTGDWNLHPDHFAERHGLFVIIALGESLIVAAGGLAGVEIGPAEVGVGLLAVALTCALWWSYFGCAKSVIDRAFEASAGVRRSMMGRDAFTLVHFLMILGVIGLAVGIETAAAHATEAMEGPSRLSLALGVTLFTGGTGLSMWRATGRMPLSRLVLALGTAPLVAAAGSSPIAALSVAFLGVLAIVVTESGLRPEATSFGADPAE